MVSCYPTRRNEFQLHVPGKERWNISFDIDDDDYEELKSNLQVVLSAPNHLEIKEK